MNPYNLYKEAVEMVRMRICSIVFVPTGWVEQFREDVDKMGNRMVEPEPQALDDTEVKQFRVHYHFPF